jgi:hypothetical protein
VNIHVSIIATRRETATCAAHRTARAGARCYNVLMRWLLVLLVACSGTAHDDPALVADFHQVERQCLQTYNDAFHRQGAGEIDELALAQVIEHDVLPPWQTFHDRVNKAPDSALVTAMRRYFADRETAWQAYVVVLRASKDDPQALATYRQKNAEATADAQALAKLLPR